MKKLQLLFSLLALPLFSDGPSNTDLQREIDQLKLSVERLSSGSQVPTEMEAGHNDSCGFMVSADLLYWQTQSDLLTYPTAFSQTSLSSLPQDIRLRDTNIDWAWGFRVGAGYQFAYDNWRLDAEYTYLRPRGNQSTSYDTEANGGLPITATSPGISANFSTGSELFGKTASVAYHLDYDYVSLLLSKNYCVSRSVDVSMQWGLAANWFDQSVVAQYTGGTEENYLNTQVLTTKNFSDSWGIGPRAGLGALWHLGAGFGLFGDFAGEIMVGKVRGTSIQEVDGSSENYVKYHFDGYRYRPQLFMQLGLSYDAFFNGASQHFGLRAGWETQVWFNEGTNIVTYPQIVQDFGNLQFSGFTLKAFFKF